MDITLNYYARGIEVAREIVYEIFTRILNISVLACVQS